ncbi:uncharacterized protein BYT42DRAFT_589227 [Radiomyces spectabilis]|uniref:uncharacterized protein n=1 Tax=Radiomyces spectabilis TaxID=64574 RepID=UPI00221EB981|nr:uncharacterized protein BYT42DRAFT_589227 [Radiomyces spectabilis]KAI8365223.1 hypothetical protein BYT42DRAFT_589227 [Radiomyces spectabilis]
MWTQCYLVTISCHSGNACFNFFFILFCMQRYTPCLCSLFVPIFSLCLVGCTNLNIKIFQTGDECSVSPLPNDRRMA